jgi:hypothetical protein
MSAQGQSRQFDRALLTSGLTLPISGHSKGQSACLKGADIVAKVPKGAAANFPPNNETSDNRRSIGLQTRYQNRL